MPEGEERGVDSDNVDRERKSSDPAILHLSGARLATSAAPDTVGRLGWTDISQASPWSRTVPKSQTVPSFRQKKWLEFARPVERRVYIAAAVEELLRSFC